MLPYEGYTGKWRFVDLTQGRIEPRDLDQALAEQYLGGNGFGTRLLWDQAGPEVDALSPQNLLVVATGPLCGTAMPTSGRVEVIAKPPLTGIYGDSNAGGFFGPELKFAGWDSLVFMGSATHPMYLHIDNQRVALRDARHLWGLTTSQTEATIQQAWKDDKIKTATIGPAGENLVRFAGIRVTSQRSAARCGLGAVMGSKNLKAIAVRGDHPVPLADPDHFRLLTTELRRRLRENPVYPAVHAHGTPGIAALMSALGRFPTKNFQMGSFDAISSIDADTLEARAFVRHMSCYGCPVGCDKLYQTPDGPYAGTELHSVEYETLNAFGANILNVDLDSILVANHLCDELGLDTISAGRAISFGMELWERGILTARDTDGLALEWGNMEMVLKLVKMMACREGLGHLLAEGTRQAAELIGRGSEAYAMHVKGLEIAAQDGRAQKSMRLAHATSNRGADHLKPFPTIDETGYSEEARRRYGEEHLPEIAEPLATRHKPFLVKDGEDYGAVPPRKARFLDPYINVGLFGARVHCLAWPFGSRNGSTPEKKTLVWERSGWIPEVRMFARVLFPTDFSAYANAVFDFLTQLKAVGLRQVALVDVIRGSEVPMPETINQVSLDRVRWSAAELLNIARLALEGQGQQVSTRVEHGSPAAEIIRVAEEERVDLIVIGAQGRTVAQELLLGSVAYEVVCRVPMPVLVQKFDVVRELGHVECRLTCVQMFSRVLFPTDFSDCARAAFQVVKHPRAAGTEEVVILHVQDERVMTQRFLPIPPKKHGSPDARMPVWAGAPG